MAFPRAALRGGRGAGPGGEQSPGLLWRPSHRRVCFPAVPDGAHQALPEVQDFRERFHNVEEM